MGLSEEAIKYIKEHKKDLINRFANPEIYKPVKYPDTIFMAGSPGAGKTEFSKKYIKLAENSINRAGEINYENTRYALVRIDADEIRNILPGYDGKNSDAFQGAASLGVNKLYDYVLKNKINALIDGTFAQLKYAEENIKRALDKNRDIVIFYVYQDPLIAWDFTKKREELEGRRVPVDAFVKDFFEAKNNVDKLKLIFKDTIELNLIKKNYENRVEKIWFDVNAPVDTYIKVDYNPKNLVNAIKKYENIKKRSKN
ncbi:MAG: zeta toxin family protein [bacterium]